MSVSATDFVISGLGLTGDWGVYYNFENYEGGFVKSEGYSQLTHSGEIIGNSSGFENQSPGSGFFDGNTYVKIQNTTNPLTDLFKKRACTFLFSQEKSGVNPGVLFSNYGHEGLPPTGWEIGINSANKLYFKSSEDSTKIRTLNNIPAAKNYYYVKAANGVLSMARYIPEIDSWNPTSWPLNQNYFLPTDSWNLGTGEYNYEGYMDQFFYFNSNVSQPSLTKIIKSVSQTLTGTSPVYARASGQIIGYAEWLTEVEGVLYKKGISTDVNYLTGSGVNITGINLTGNVTDGDVYYEFTEGYTHFGSGSLPRFLNFYRKKVAYQQNIANQIIGFETGASGYHLVFSGDRFQNSGVSGILRREMLREPLYSSGITYPISSGIAQVSGDGAVDNTYLKNAAAYLGNRGGSDFTNRITNINPTQISKEANFGMLEKFGHYGFYTDRNYPPSEVNLFMNWVAQLSGAAEIVESTKTQNPNIYEPELKTGNYLLYPTYGSSGHLILDSFFNNLDEILYDINSTVQGSVLEIVATPQYENHPFSEIPIEGNQIFFNGQKIYSGIDYIDAGGFTPTGYITGIAGKYYTAPIPRGASETTSLNEYDFSEQYLSGNSYEMYLNGVRQPRNAFVEFSHGVSLLSTGINVVETGLQNIYNIEGQY